MSIEAQVAAMLAHQDRTDKLLARTGGEIIHPDHFDLRNDLRDAVLAGMDAVCAEGSFPHVRDDDLPGLFRTLDALAEKIFLRRMGL